MQQDCRYLLCFLGPWLVIRTLFFSILTLATGHTWLTQHQILNQANLPNTKSLRRWLLERTIHPQLGGFGKIAGDLPDLYHSYLGLAALSLLGEEKLKPLDPSLCMSKEAKGRLKGIWKRWGIEQ
jgi:prenyltransferase beta subunit